jgi:hypothetical protein
MKSLIKFFAMAAFSSLCAAEVVLVDTTLAVSAGYLNDDQSKILVDSSEHRFSQAWCDGDTKLQKITFVRHQNEKPEKMAYRQVSSNFSYQAGDIYAIKKRKLALHCFVFNESFTTGKTFLSATHLTEKNLSKEQLLRISTMKNRAIKNSWLLAKLSDGSIYAAVWFVPHGAQELASYVLLTSNDIYFDDAPATRKTKDEDLWGMGDQGKFSPRLGSVFFSYQTTDGIGLATEHYGGEGTNLMIHEFSLKQAKTVAHAYFYSMY